MVKRFDAEMGREGLRRRERAKSKWLATWDAANGADLQWLKPSCSSLEIPSGSSLDSYAKLYVGSIYSKAPTIR